MKITKTEEVTRTYCDVCNTDITRSNYASEGDADFCMESKFKVKRYDYKNGKDFDLTVTCAEIYSLNNQVNNHNIRIKFRIECREGYEN